MCFVPLIHFMKLHKNAAKNCDATLEFNCDSCETPNRQIVFDLIKCCESFQTESKNCLHNFVTSPLDCQPCFRGNPSRFTLFVVINNVARNSGVTGKENEPLLGRCKLFSDADIFRQKCGKHNLFLCATKMR